MKAVFTDTIARPLSEKRTTGLSCLVVAFGDRLTTGKLRLQLFPGYPDCRERLGPSLSKAVISDQPFRVFLKTGEGTGTNEAFEVAAVLGEIIAAQVSRTRWARLSISLSSAKEQ